MLVNVSSGVQPPCGRPLLNVGNTRQGPIRSAEMRTERNLAGDKGVYHADIAAEKRHNKNTHLPTRTSEKMAH